MDAGRLIRHGRWWLRRERSRLGWRGLAGAALLLATLAVAVLALRPAAQRIDSLRTEVTALRAALRTGTVAAPVPPASRADQLDTFHAFFPGADTLPAWLERIHEAARHNGIALDVGDYQLQPGGAERLMRYHVRLPVRGSYPQIRAFVAEVLNRVPAAALEELQLRREAIGAPQLEARLSFVVLLGGGR
jgi:Tfp pilus assembly protein PilO